ncbi:uncharacterized protein LOC123551627 [Mercenaria mercenaria]|uniref:uncharacterized protein LOC123551627 n=1 Tax=Mercenaria mercenaria TaxID=6596 RepID=UPI00234F151E|nr:uncharacterized protein LOC123551627 [Mercenaria mercenaria]
MSQDEEREVFPFPGKVKSSVWEFFGFYKDDFGHLDKSRAICKLCRKGTNYSGNTTNLRTHIVHHHKDVAALPDVNYSRAQLSRSTPSHNQEGNFGSSVFNQMHTSPDGYSQTTPPKLQRQILLDEIFVQPLSSELSGNLSRSATQQNTWVMETATGLVDSHTVFSKDSPAQDNSSGSFADSEAESYGSIASVKDAVFETVIQDLIPIEAVDSSRFKKLISTGKKLPIVPSSCDISDLITRRYSELQVVINNELLKGIHKSLKLELWKSCDITYLTVSVQALFDNWKMRCYALKTVELHENFSLKEVKEVLGENTTGLNVDNILSEENDIIENFADENGCVYLVTLCNTIDKVAKLCIEENIGKKLVKKVQKIVKLLTENQEARSVFHEKQNVLQLPTKSLVHCNNRIWTRCLATFESVLEQSNAIIATFNDPRVKALDMVDQFTSGDFALIQTFINMLVPLKTALTLTKDMKHPTVAVILPVLKKLEMSLADRETDSQQVVELKIKMVRTLKQHYEVTDRRHFLLLCSLLDPRFKGLKFVCQSDQDVAYEQLKQGALELKNTFKTTEGTESDQMDKYVVVKVEVSDDYPDNEATGSDRYSRNSEEADGNSDLHQRAKRQKLMDNAPKACENAADDWFADVIQEIKDGQPEEDSVTVEINRYKGEIQISSGSSPLAWWRDRQKSFPLLSQIAKRYVSVPALLGTKDETTERWYRRQRGCIPVHLVDPVVFLHANYEKVKRLGDEF